MKCIFCAEEDPWDCPTLKEISLVDALAQLRLLADFCNACPIIKAVARNYWYSHFIARTPEDA